MQSIQVRAGGRVVNKALVIAHGVHETGGREILGIDVGEAETDAFWTGFLRGLVARSRPPFASRKTRMLASAISCRRSITVLSRELTESLDVAVSARL
jgi:hypothetical protein